MFVPLKLSDHEEIKGRDVSCIFHATRLCLMVRGTVVVEGKLYTEIDPEDSSWQLGA